MLANGDKLKGLIRAKGHKYRSLEKEAKDKGITLNQSTISNVANGTHGPSYPTIQALYTVLEMTPQEGAEIFLKISCTKREYQKKKFKRGIK